MSVNGTGANYAPLKQILSDSESEEEHRAENAFMKITDNSNNLDFNSGLQSSKNYSISDMDDFNTNVNTLESTMDNVSIIESENIKKMSFPRRCATIASLFVCFFTVVIFIWGIPCKGVRICEGPNWKDKVTWELPYDEIELCGKAQVVDGALPRTKNLIFIYRGNLMKKNVNPNDNVNGVLLIVGNTGQVGWYTRENRIPTFVHCHLIDVNKDNQKDCVVSGSEGLLTALNPVSGTYYWYIHKQGMFLNITKIDFPIAIKDINKDKVDDLLTVATIYPNTNHNTLVLISGATGNIISDFVKLDDCRSVKLISEADMVSYICKNSTTESVRIISYALIMKSNETANHIPTISPAVPKKNYNATWKENGKDIYKFGIGKLYLENSGECPESCRVSLKLVFEKDGATNVTWEYAANHVFAMNPILFVFSKNAINGFIIQLRQWNSAQLASGSQKIDEIRYNIQNKSPKNPYDIFHYQPSINIPSIASYIKYTNYTVYSISERIVLVTFDKVQMHNVNISQTDIVQLCVRGPIDTDLPMPVCQPYLDNKYSHVTIADFNSDNSHEVISYYSTFVGPEHNGKNPNDGSLRLTSIVKVIRLETVLPKLFVFDD